MPAKIAVADGLLTAAATWAVVDGTSLLDAENANTSLGTSYTNTAAFTPGAITIDGIAVKIASRSATPGANQLFVRLGQAGATVAGTELAIDVADIAGSSGEPGWYFFKFAAPVVLAAATAYTVGARTTATSMVNLYRNATASNWSRMLRTTTTGAPAGGDDLFILGEHTGAGARTARAVTMNSTAATDYGGGSIAVVGFGIGIGGTVRFATAAATTYILRLSANLGVWLGGTLEMGTAATPIPRDSSARIEFDCLAAGDFGLRVWGTFTAYGVSRSAGKSVVRCVLTADAAAAATTLSVSADTGWLSGDDIAIASTTRATTAHTQAETRALAADAGASSLTVTAGLTHAHGGTTPVVAEVIGLTRNVRVEAVNSSFVSFVYVGAVAQVAVEWVSFRHMGTATTGKRGIEIELTTGSVTCRYCALRDFAARGLYFNANSDNWTVEHLVGWKVGHQATGHAAVYVATTAGTNWRLTDVDIIAGNSSGGYGVDLEALGGVVERLRVNSGGGSGVRVWGIGGVAANLAPLGRIVGLDAHAHTDNGLTLHNVNLVHVEDFRIWRNNAGGILLASGSVGRFVGQDGVLFGNTTFSLSTGTSSASRLFTLRNVQSNGDSSFATTNGILAPTSGNNTFEFELENCVFSAVSGIFTAHTNDLSFQGTGTYVATAKIRHCQLLGTNKYTGTTNLIGRSAIVEHNVGQVANVHQAFYPNVGTVSYDGTLFRSAAPSERLEPIAPAGPLWKLETGPKRLAIPNGAALTVACWVRKSAAYNGSAPRLVLRANASVGILADVVLATFSAAADVWQQLSGATPIVTADGVLEVVVDCDGSAGAVYVDDWAAG